MPDTRLNTAALAAATGALLALLALGYLLLTAWGDYRLLQQAPDYPADEGPRRDPRRPFALGGLLQANLFGETGRSPAAAREPRQEEAPETRLSLELKGAFSSSLNEAGGALIAERGKPAQYYQVGDRLPGGATLERVAANHVQLRRSGRLERLSFSPPGTASAAPTSALVSRPQPAPVPASSVSRRSVADPGDRRVESLRERLRQLREAQQNHGDD